MMRGYFLTKRVSLLGEEWEYFSHPESYVTRIREGIIQREKKQVRENEIEKS
jgi:hypothetical protein